ncbi:Serine/threonine protein kinase PrkC, regulator of stationary phase [Minicystis rosea]|nr:Serine/threonine protein kinase PrkC, regulator of stationary phase [Minicystis rosea]
MPEQSDSPRSPVNAEATVRVRPEEEDPPSRRALLPPDPAPSPALVDGRYRIEGELGRGAMGVVYRATEEWLDRPVALKVIAPSLLDDTHAPMRFLREAKALASVRSHHVVQVYAFGPHRGSYFYAMEYVPGRSLKEILAEHRRHGDTVPVHRALTILAQIAEGISAVHAAGIVHRDIKPSNIIIEDDTGRPVLVDFGLAAPGDDRAYTMAMGTPLYMSPEQTGLRPDAPVSARTDVYSLGCTAFEMLAGQPPFRHENTLELMRMHAERPAPLLSSIRPELAAFDKSLARAMAKRPADRYASAVDLTNDLAAAGARWRTGHLTSRPPPLPLEKDAPLRVLVIEADPAFAKFVAQAVHLAFFQCDKDLRVQLIHASSGDDAIERAEIEPPRLVLLDYDLPGLDAADTLSRLRAVPGAERARVVVMSRHVLSDDRWRFTVLGVRDFMAKPASFMQLVRHISKIAERVTPSAPSTGR